MKFCYTLPEVGKSIKFVFFTSSSQVNNATAKINTKKAQNANSNAALLSLAALQSQNAIRPATTYSQVAGFANPGATYTAGAAYSPLLG